MLDIQRELAKAVKHYWKTRAAQSKRQGRASGIKPRFVIRPACAFYWSSVV
jgi:hypothetical protein